LFEKAYSQRLVGIKKEFATKVVCRVRILSLNIIIGNRVITGK